MKDISLVGGLNTINRLRRYLSSVGEPCRDTSIEVLGTRLKLR